MREVALTAPTLELMVDDTGEFWRVHYMGMTREHRQYWQAYVYWAWANALYSSVPAKEKH